ncbi:serine hydrolase domain-containing protein [Catellatospora sp. KI3]|uniref:serine hydrolase domain-containing protein n=1 Tax=Catellatospora sp. KI3 TaxID=3041620 RepID=UPI0024822D4D|nr:serine hydrolase domain-containing protein [Catellatospora sp. KI3]MDI1464567.1 serine hydrolase domain-containing protein [Catellatospora sp. KI3]
MSETPLLPATSRALLHRIATAQTQGRAPSLTAAVVRDGARVWSAGYGLVDGAVPDEDTQYRIGSLTKTFVAVLVMRLRADGLLDLDDRLSQHVPDAPAGSATVFQLLAHTSGIASETPAPWWERTPGDVRPNLGDVLADDHRKFPAGHRHHYSNPGFALLGALVERLRGQSLEQVLRQEILAPLGMTRTTLLPRAPHARGWAVHPWADVLLPEPTEDAGLLAPAGQLWSTTADLCRFAAFLAEGHPAVLPKAAVELMRTAAAPPEGDRFDDGYGLGVQLKRDSGRVLAGHTGSMPGFLAVLWFSPTERVATVAMANTTSGLPIGGLGADLVRIVCEHEPRIPDAWQPLTGYDPALLDLTGPWYWGPGGVGLKLCADGDLELAPLAGAGRGARLRAQPDGTWLGLDGYYAGETLRVVRRPDGSVDHLDLGSFVFTRTPYDPAADVPGGVDPDGWRGR